MPAEPILLTQSMNVDVRFPDGTTKQLLADIDVNIAEGQCLAIVGESGSGKTTLGRAVARLLPATMTVTGNIVTRGRVGYMVQDAASALNPVRRVTWQVAEALRARGVSRSNRADMVLDLLGRCGLPDPDQYARRYPHELSGGLAQRVLLATVLATEPTIIVADEPTSALDVTTQARVIALLKDLISHTNVSLMIITHDLTVAAHIGHHISVMRGGRIVEQGPVAQVFADAQHAYTRELLAALPKRSRASIELETRP